MSAYCWRLPVRPWCCVSVRHDRPMKKRHGETLRTDGCRRMTSMIRKAVIIALFFGANLAAEPKPTPPADAWPSFRGNSRMTGVAGGNLASELVVRWKVDVKEPVTSTAAIVDGVVYIGADDFNLYALNLADGTVRWKYAAKEAIRSSPTVEGGVVYFGDQEGTFHAVDAAVGSAKWTFKTEAEALSSPLLVNGKVVFGSYDANVFCLSAADGSLVWKYETGGRVHASPALADESVIVAGCDEFVHVLALADGRETLKIGMGSVVGASPAIIGDRAFVGTYNQDVLGFEWKSGKVLWRFRDEDRQFPILASAAANEKFVVVGGRDKRVRAFDADTGVVKWTFAAKARIDSSPVIVGDRVFVGSNDGNLYAVSLSEGKEAWKFETGAPISASPSVAGGMLVIGNEDGVIYCFGAKAEK